MNPVKILVGLVPWVLFSVLVRIPGDATAGFAALAAAALSVGLILATRKSGVKIIEVGSAVVFGVLTMIAFLGGAAGNVWVADYGRASAAFVLAAVMLVSAATVPFTEQYARASVPQQYWGSPTFRAVNRKISALWGLVMLGMGVAHVTAVAISNGGGVGSGSVLLNWAIPVGLIFAGISGTKRIADSATAAPQVAPR